ncbi:PAS domain S-box protein [Myxococcota bacterium]|nr:PAS domain S-box protein [Myxococcota bacterium]MBU1380270.1 PAS domain S-box protein [Myxococcota bacterium]MBU1496383.1 PAS domain S-box protein [Myxococcota bacterium]
MKTSSDDNYQIYKNIFENLHDAYFHMNKKGEIYIASPSCINIFGISDIEIIGKNFFTDFNIDEDRLRQLSERLETEGSVSDFESVVHRRDGSSIWISTNASYFLDENGSIAGVEASSRDITERKNLEEQLIRAERMAAVGTLAGGVAHEFNNINLAILGYAELGLFREGVEPEIKNYFKTIRKSALRARSIISNLLTFSGSRTGRLEAANLRKVVEETMIMLSHEVSSGGIEIETELNPTPDTVMDYTQIGQVILNILINAHHALTDREIKKIIISTGHDDKNVFVKISDTGCGIPRDNLQKIFSPFFTTKGEHSNGTDAQSKVKGTGLGLSVSHTIVMNHKGDIKVESEVGQGTTFTLSLPVIAAPAQSGVRSGSNWRKKMPIVNILVLDDEPDLRELLEKFFTNKGHVVFQTGNGNEALKIMSENTIDVVLVDLQMPQMTGMQFLEKATRLNLSNKPAFIVITGRSSEPSAEIENYAYCTVYKPFKLNEILEVTREAIFSRYK